MCLDVEATGGIFYFWLFQTRHNLRQATCFSIARRLRIIHSSGCQTAHF